MAHEPVPTVAAWTEDSFRENAKGVASTSAVQMRVNLVAIDQKFRGING